MWQITHTHTHTHTHTQIQDEKCYLSMGFSKQEYWTGLPFPFSGDLSDPEMEPGSPAWQADSLLACSYEGSPATRETQTLFPWAAKSLRW